MSFAKAVCRTRNNPRTESKRGNFFCINRSGLLSMVRLRNRKNAIAYFLSACKAFSFSSCRVGRVANWSAWFQETERYGRGRLVAANLLAATKREDQRCSRQVHDHW